MWNTAIGHARQDSSPTVSAERGAAGLKAAAAQNVGGVNTPLAD